jgi:hypothetical protein
MSTDTDTGLTAEQEAEARDIADAAREAAKAEGMSLDDAKAALAVLALAAMQVALDPSSTARDAKAAGDAIAELCEAIELLDEPEDAEPGMGLPNEPVLATV